MMAAGAQALAKGENHSMDEIKRFLRNADEAQDLFWRAAAAFPLRRDMASLKARREAGDPCVVEYRDERGNVERYALKFTELQRTRLEEGYFPALGSEAPSNNHHHSYREDRDFVGIIEGLGDVIIDHEAAEPPEQKQRQRSVDSLVNAVEKIDIALSDLDSAALGWLYACVVDRLSEEGISVSAGDSQVVSMRTHPMRAMTEAGELRAVIKSVVAVVVEAAKEARTSLPKATRRDPRLKVAVGLRYHMERHRLPFGVEAAGYAGQCLEALFEVAGVPGENVAYWLKEAAKIPDPFKELF